MDELSFEEELKGIIKNNSVEEIFRSLVRQINKDLNISIAETGFGTQNPFQYLYEKVYPIVSELYFHKKPEWMKIVYRVDLYESGLKKIIHGNSNETIVKKLTEFVIKRELQKVVIRFYYK